MQSKDTQLLTAAAGDTLTGAYIATTKTIRLESKSSIQFELLYAKNAGEAAADTKYVDCYLEYTNAEDTQARDGISIPADASWHPYKEELDDGAGASTFYVRHWKILSTDATANIDLSAIFTRPLFVNRVRLQVKEFGVAAFGTLIAKASAQAI